MTAARLQAHHVPVMLAEVIESLAPRNGGRYVDGTFGGGGYSAAILEKADCTVWGIDRDGIAVSAGHALSKRHHGRFNAIHGCFGNMSQLLRQSNVDAVDGIALDLGLSSVQLDDAERGFSFRADGPLDMRMDRDNGAPSAADIVNSADEKVLADIIWRLGEERHSRRIARSIVQHRQIDPITRTSQLAEIVRGMVPHAKDRIDPATRTFQALRIYVNDELGELERGLLAAEEMLAANGRLVVVSFHSLEDRAVKQFLRSRSGRNAGTSRHLPPQETTNPPTFRLLGRGLVRPSDREITANPRARSAGLRAATRTAAQAWPNEAAA
jgi:16S rRNA (cytosine1402-N4)-methyltransferase